MPRILALRPLDYFDQPQRVARIALVFEETVIERTQEFALRWSPDGGTNHDHLNQLIVTPRDQQVLNLLVQGCSNKEIGGQLNIGQETVKQHLRAVFLRAGISEGANV